VSTSLPPSDRGRTDVAAASTAEAPGLTYQNPGAPGASQFAPLDIGRANNVTALRATKPAQTQWEREPMSMPAA
jgi:hypothetical protein